MKTKQEIYSKLMATLWELEETNPNENLEHMLKSQLEVLDWVLGEDIEEDIQIRIENQIYG